MNPISRESRETDERRSMSERLRLRRLREFNSQYLTIRQQIQEAEERGLTDRAQRLRRLEVRASATESAIR